MKNASTKAVLFGLDGTLDNSAPDLATAVDLMLADLGLPAAGEQSVRRWLRKRNAGTGQTGSRCGTGNPAIRRPR